MLYVGQCQSAFVCVGGSGYVCLCVCGKGRQREEAGEEVSDSHVLELGHVSQACCVRIS